MQILMKQSPHQSRYHLSNWQAYDAALKQRGSLTFWICEEVIEQWHNEGKTGGRGASKDYSDLAIATMATLQAVFGLPGRQAEGFLESVFTLMGVPLRVPDHSTLSRRMGKLEVELPVVPKAKAVPVVVDSTGVKVYGEGEWKTRQHGISKRRTWRKLHLGVDEATGEILSAAVTTHDWHDGEVLPKLLDGIEEEIEQVSGDGAYDHRSCYEAIAQRQAKATIPPRQGAKLWQHDNCKRAPHPRDENLRWICKVGPQGWKHQSDYHRRSLAETTRFRLKTIFGGKLRRRTFDNQAVELFVQCAALNCMIGLCKPDTYVVES